VSYYGGHEEVIHLDVDDESKSIVRESLAQMTYPVELHFFTSRTCANRDINWCIPTEELLDLFTQLAPQGMLRVNKYIYEKSADAFEKFGVEPYRVPAIYFEDGFIRYLGAPMGEEARGFLETIVRLGTGRTGLRQRTRAELAALARTASRRVYILTFTTPSCPYCPYAALIANMFAYESRGRVLSVVIDAYENPDLANMYGVMGVPAVVIQPEGASLGEIEFVGVPPEHALLARVKSLAT
jgi:glutaredoxin-like protein